MKHARPLLTRGAAGRGQERRALPAGAGGGHGGLVGDRLLGQRRRRPGNNFVTILAV